MGSLILDRVGYDARFIERSKLLRIIYDAIQEKSLVRTSIELGRIDQGEDYATVVSGNGIQITANVVVGADGVHSSIRKYIEQCFLGGPIHNVKKATSTKLVLLADRLRMKTRFTCIFGMSPGISELQEGEAFAVYRKGTTVLAFTGKRVIFWFVFKDLGQTLPLTCNPSYLKGDIEEICLSVRHLHLTPTVRFGDIYATRFSVQKTMLEEGIAENWHAKGMVIIGDAAHKVSHSRPSVMFVMLMP